VKVLLDECVDRRFAKELKGHLVKTVPQMGWAAKKNGELLALAEKEFDVFITVDRNLSFQQNLPKFSLAVLVLHARSNRLADLIPLVPQVLSMIPTLSKGRSEMVTLQKPEYSEREGSDLAHVAYRERGSQSCNPREPSRRGKAQLILLLSPIPTLILSLSVPAPHGKHEYAYRLVPGGLEYYRLTRNKAAPCPGTVTEYSGPGHAIS
jgi:hypothetical protein